MPVRVPIPSRWSPSKSELLMTATSLLLLKEDTKRWFDGYVLMFMRSDPGSVRLLSMGV